MKRDDWLYREIKDIIEDEFPDDNFFYSHNDKRSR